jgi:hypothetical protein
MIDRNLLLVSTGENVTCMDMCRSFQPNSIPIFVTGTAAGKVEANYGFENIGMDASMRVTQWRTAYSLRHTSKVIGVGVIETKSCIVIVSASANEIIYRHMLEPDMVIKKTNGQIAALKTFDGSNVCIAMQNGNILIHELEFDATCGEYKIAPKQVIKAADIKSNIKETSYVGLNMKHTTRPFDEMAIFDHGRKIALTSASALAVFSLNQTDFKPYHSKSVLSNGGIKKVARQTHAEHAWLMRNSTISVLSAGTRTEKIIPKFADDLCDLCVFQQCILIALASSGKYYLVDPVRGVFYSSEIPGCGTAFAIKEIEDRLYILCSGTPTDCRINTDIINGKVLITQLIRGNKTYGASEFPLSQQKLPPKDHVDSVFGALFRWCTLKAGVEIKGKNVRQMANECYYLSLALPVLVPANICRLFDTYMDTMPDHVMYIMLKCIHGVIKVAAPPIKYDIARVLTRCFLGFWRHRDFALHLILIDAEIAKLAREWIAGAAFEMSEFEQTIDLIKQAECLDAI